MELRKAGLAILVVVPVLIFGCQLLGSSTQVRFQNAAGSGFTLASIQFGSLADASPLAPGSTTSYFSVEPGQGTLSAQTQTGVSTNGILFTIVAGHSYTITFSTTASVGITAVMTADN